MPSGLMRVNLKLLSSCPTIFQKTICDGVSGGILRIARASTIRFLFELTKKIKNIIDDITKRIRRKYWKIIDNIVKRTEKKLINIGAIIMRRIKNRAKNINADITLERRRSASRRSKRC